MAFGNLPTDGQGTPLGAGYIPNDALYAMQLSQRKKTDTIGNVSAPIMLEMVNQEYVREGLMYISTTGTLATATNPTLTMGASLFNASGSGKTIVVVSARLSQNAAQTVNELRLTTSDPALAQAGTPVCMLAGGGIGSVASFTYPATNAASSVSTPGTLLDWAMTSTASTTEFIPNGFGFILPAGSAFGLALYTVIASAGGLYAITFKHVEY